MKLIEKICNRLGYFKTEVPMVTDAVVFSNRTLPTSNVSLILEKNGRKFNLPIGYFNKFVPRPDGTSYQAEYYVVAVEKTTAMPALLDILNETADARIHKDTSDRFRPW